MDLRPIDEGRHEPGDEPLWGESWYHDWAAQDGSCGGYVRLGLYPNQDVAWYWVHLVRKGEPLVLIRDHAVPCPTAMDGPLRVASDRVRGEWAPVDPLRSYRIQTDGTAVALKDPADAFHGEQGPDVSVSLDLTWEGAAPCFPYTATTRFEQSAWVRGEVTIGDERIAVDCPGQRDHSWGVRDWWAFPWMWCSGRLDDGMWWHCVIAGLNREERFTVSYIVDTGRDEWRPVEHVQFGYEVDKEQLPKTAMLTLEDLVLHITSELHAPVLLESTDGKTSRFPRAMSTVHTADGRTGHCWLEFNFPQ